ncbi:hypothetical protein HMPREF9123_0487 [Neisseria bacilliformis ATCC BAA-1200]|uniref:Uncharacterized protein n=1 Tax=Neisseria bacilliformis ATCC BAA-1200 TaxID=888742 RepID=F2B9T3_9NEIS|nr:hypothetical protein HMPREF9123_0487 [Neisseria bacilliformis ATCC BAA-1200]
MQRVRRSHARIFSGSAVGLSGEKARGRLKTGFSDGLSKRPLHCARA